MKKTGYVLFTGEPYTYIQESPNWNCTCVGSLINGSILNIIGEQDGWFEILLDNKTTAWVLASRVYIPTEFITLVGEVANPSSSSTTVQRIPSSDSSQYSGKFSNGDNLTIISENNGWYQFLNAGATSWIPCADVYIRETGYVFSFTDIQKESTWNSSCIGSLNNGAITTITGEQDGWFEILNCGSPAWVPVDRVKITDSTTFKGNGNYRAYGYTEGQYKVALEVYNFFSNAGWTNNAIIGMLGNMAQESSLIPTEWQNGDVGDDRVGFGLVQWTPASKLIDWCNENGYDYKQVSSQCERILYELKNGLQYEQVGFNISFRKYTQLNDSPTKMAQIFCSNYEQAGIPDTGHRIEYAKQWSEILG